MSRKHIEFQPGAILHEVIVGAFRARGHTLGAWCKENGISPMNVRNVTFGQSRGEGGTALLDRLISDAGRDFVRDAYVRRIAEHARQIQRGAA